MPAANLPAVCYTRHPITNRVVLIVRGQSGYRDFTPMHPGPLDVDALNAAANVTKAQAAAMKCGSMFGWDTPSADPACYDEEGRLRLRD